MWTVRSDNYNDYVADELTTDRPAEWLTLIHANAPENRPLRVLDAGCGPGFFSVLLSLAGHTVTGIDGSEGMLAHARENAARHGVSPELMQVDFGALPFADGAFDIVLCMNGFHVFPDKTKAYTEILRTLKSGGELLACFYVAGEKKTAREILSLALRAVCAAMGVAVAALSALGELDSHAAISMLGVGLACAGISLLEKNA